MALATLSVIVIINFIIDFFLFSRVEEGLSIESLAHTSQPYSRSVASFEGINFISGFSLEKEVFENLKNSQEKDLVSKGESPDSMDRFIFGSLGGQYQVRQKNNKVMEIQFASPYLKPKNLPDRESFLETNLTLFSDKDSRVRLISSEHDLSGRHDLGEEILKEKFQILSYSGQNLGYIQFFLDKDQNLVSMKFEEF